MEVNPQGRAEQALQPDVSRHRDAVAGEEDHSIQEVTQQRQRIEGDNNNEFEDDAQDRNNKDEETRTDRLDDNALIAALGIVHHKIPPPYCKRRLN
ncbi:hypothetical protein B0A54_14301 [Friedmanniomyces endolithicus]|uniref:Uncharacterized protein n=1 Tax=Friedmanniomyces endolithicus TaxID=329885 RepID=A0A4U0U7Z7_9PEZI|nr:hypothetical protein B0A54_14301 [Friedmanniomyces endolithicus]